MTQAITSRPLETTYPQEGVSAGSESSSVSGTSEAHVAPAALDVREGTPGLTPQMQSSGAHLAAPLPSAQTVTQPPNYQRSLTSGKEKLEAGAMATSPAALAMLSVENDAVTGKATKNNKALSAGDKADIVEKQSQNILDSAEKTEKRGCKTKPKNTDETASKIKQLGYSDRETKMLTRILQNKHAPDSVKAKIAYELAAQGMTGSGQANTAALASNSEKMHKELGAYASKEADTFAAIEKKIAPIPIVAAIQGLVQADKSMHAMKNTADGLVSGVQTEARFDGPHIAQPTQGIPQPLSIFPHNAGQSIQAGDRDVDGALLRNTLGNAAGAL